MGILNITNYTSRTSRVIKSILIAFFVSFFSCTTEKPVGEQKLYSYVQSLDSLFRMDSVDLREVSRTIEAMKPYFEFSTTKTADEEIWKSNIRFKWNQDSSIALINSLKTYDVGFKRETIIHSNDSILFIHRFMPGVAANDTTKLNFVETIDYLSPRKTIKTLIRIANFETLSDSVKFMTLPFKDISKTVQEHYNFELDYCQDIINHN